VHAVLVVGNEVSQGLVRGAHGARLRERLSVRDLRILRRAVVINHGGHLAADCRWVFAGAGRCEALRPLCTERRANAVVVVVVVSWSEGCKVEILEGSVQEVVAPFSCLADHSARVADELPRPVAGAQLSAARSGR